MTGVQTCALPIYRLTCWKTRITRFKLSRLKSVAKNSKDPKTRHEPKSISGGNFLWSMVLNRKADGASPADSSLKAVTRGQKTASVFLTDASAFLIRVRVIRKICCIFLRLKIVSALNLNKFPKNLMIELQIIGMLKACKG